MHYYYWCIQRCLNVWLVCCVTLLLPAWFIAVAVKLNPLYSAFILVSYWHFSLTSGQQLAWYKGETAAGLWMKEMAWKTIGWKRGFLGQSVWPVKGLMGNKMLLALCHSLLLLSRLWGEKGKRPIPSHITAIYTVQWKTWLSRACKWVQGNFSQWCLYFILNAPLWKNVLSVMIGQ